MRLVQMIGRRFGRLSVLRRVKNDGRFVRYLCQCKCGKQTKVRGVDLRSGNTRSCRCLGEECRSERAIGNQYGRTHGHNSTTHRSGTYYSWATMIQRCLNPNSPTYNLYGGAGVRVCRAWRTFEGFLADMGERPQGTTLGRLLDSGNYTKRNCRWMTKREQVNEQLKKKARGGRIPFDHIGFE